MFQRFGKRSLICGGGFLLSSSFINQHDYSKICQKSNNENTPMNVLTKQGKNYSKFHLFSGSSSQLLSQQVATILGKPLSQCKLIQYADGEKSVAITENLRGKHVYIIQSVPPPISDNLMELLLFVSATKRASATQVTVIMPYYPYSRHDRIRRKRETIAAREIATLFESVGTDRILTVDLHRRQIEGFLNPCSTQIETLETQSTVLPVLLEKDLYEPVIVCPSDTGIFRAKKLRQLFRNEGIPSSIAFITTYENDDSIEVDEFNEDYVNHRRKIKAVKSKVIGDVKHKDVIIVDDMIDTGSRLVNAANQCKLNKCNRLFAFATHGLFSEDAITIIDKSPINEVFVTNSIYPPKFSYYNWTDPNQWTDKISYISIAPLIAESIRRMEARQSLSNFTHL